MKCPRDNAAMIFTDDGRHTSNRCGRCSGLLLDAEAVAGAMGEGRGSLSPERIRALPEGGLACPRDGAAMRALVHKEVELDLCPDCGALWLDAGELDKIGARKASRKALAGAALAAAGGAAAVAAAAPGAGSSIVRDLASGVGEFVGEIAVDGVVEVALEFAGQAVGTLLESIF
jgi:Zn-finger nucleic acid-binding protein